MEENTKPAKERKTNVKKENTSKKDTKKKTNAKKNDSNGNTKEVNAQKNDSNGNKKKTKVTQNSSNANKKRTNSGKKGINTKKIEKSDTTKRATRTDTRIKKIIQEQIENIEKIDEIINEDDTKRTEDTIKKFDKEKIDEEIEQANKIPKEEKRNIRKSVMENFWSLLLVIGYFIFIKFGMLNIPEKIFIADLKVFSMLVLAMAIFWFEYAYSKDNGKSALMGIESLMIAIITLLSIYVFLLHKELFSKTIIIMMGCVVVYYTIKAIAIYAKKRKQWKDGMSDVREIIK